MAKFRLCGFRKISLFPKISLLKPCRSGSLPAGARQASNGPLAAVQALETRYERLQKPFENFAKSTKMTDFRRGDSGAHKRLQGKVRASFESLAADLARL